MADRVVEIGLVDIGVDPVNPNGWIGHMEAFSVSSSGAGIQADRISVDVPIAAADTIATWEAKRRDAYRLAVGKPSAPVILITYKVAP